MNRLLRQHFPKHSGLSADMLATIAEKLNNRPRKRLNWQSPTQLFATELESPQQTRVETTD